MRYRSPLSHAMVKVAEKATKGTYAPDMLAHEMGHASVHKNLPLLMPARTIAPTMGSVINLATDRAVGLAGHLVPLADEALSSRKAIRYLRQDGADEDTISAAKKRLGLGFASYAVGPAVDAGVLVGGISAGSRALRATAPFLGRAATRAASPRIQKKIDDVPIKGLSKAEAKAMAGRINPDVDVHFAKRPLPEKGAYLSPTRTGSTGREQSRLASELASFIGRKASGKLLRKGGVVVGPST